MWIIWPFRKKNFGSAASICEDFAVFIEPHIGKYAIRDEKFLPHAKNEIFSSICIAAHEGDADRMEIYKTLAFELTFFQKDVGKSTLHPLGIDIDNLRMGTLHAAEISRIYASNPSEKRKYDRYKLMQDAEWGPPAGHACANPEVSPLLQRRPMPRP